MMLWALVFAADMAEWWEAEERKSRLRKAMVGYLFGSCCILGRNCYFVESEEVLAFYVMVLRIQKKLSSLLHLQILRAG